MKSGSEPINNSMNDMRKFIKILEDHHHNGDGFSYDEAGKNAPSAVQQAIAEFHNLPEAVKKNTPLLYYILGSGTPEYKMSHADSEYTDKASNPSTTCGNCEFAYQKVINKKFICSQIRGHIQPEGWCNQWVKGKLD